LVRAGGTPALPVEAEREGRTDIGKIPSLGGAGVRLGEGTGGEGPIGDTGVPGARNFERKKRRSGRRKMTAPEFGLKEVGSLFYIQLPLGPFF
jgi:hypothetical protein